MDTLVKIQVAVKSEEELVCRRVFLAILGQILTVLGSLHANQSLLAVGNNPILQHLYIPNPTQAN